MRTRRPAPPRRRSVRRHRRSTRAPAASALNAATVLALRIVSACPWNPATAYVTWSSRPVLRRQASSRARRPGRPRPRTPATSLAAPRRPVHWPLLVHQHRIEALAVDDQRAVAQRPHLGARPAGQGGRSCRVLDLRPLRPRRRRRPSARAGTAPAPGARPQVQALPYARPQAAPGGGAGRQLAEADVGDHQLEALEAPRPARVMAKRSRMPRAASQARASEPTRPRVARSHLHRVGRPSGHVVLDRSREHRAPCRCR